MLFDKYPMNKIGFVFNRDLEKMQLVFKKKQIVGTLPCADRISGMKMIQFHAQKGDLVEYLNETAVEC